MTPAQIIVLVGTICTGVAGIVTAYAAVVRAKKESRTEAEIECLERLKESKLEYDAQLDELRDLRALKRRLE